MKTSLLKICTIFLFLSLMGTGCKKEEIQYADESIEISSDPGFCIYKTDKNYLNNVEVGIDSLGNVSWNPIYNYSSNDVVVDNGNVSLKHRYLLKSGYILDFSGFNIAYTDITIKEMCEKYEEFGPNYWPGKFQSRIIDKDPYIEYYYMAGMHMPERIFTLGEINKLVENHSLETVFTKLK